MGDHAADGDIVKRLLECAAFMTGGHQRTVREGAAEIERIRNIGCEIINERNMLIFQVADLRDVVRSLLPLAVDSAASEADWAAIKAAEEAL